MYICKNRNYWYNVRMRIKMRILCERLDKFLQFRIYTKEWWKIFNIYVKLNFMSIDVNIFINCLKSRLVSIYSWEYTYSMVYIKSCYTIPLFVVVFRKDLLLCCPFLEKSCHVHINVTLSSIFNLLHNFTVGIDTLITFTAIDINM